MPRRIIVTRYGGPDTLQVLEEDRAEPKHEMLPESCERSATQLDSKNQTGKGAFHGRAACARS